MSATHLTGLSGTNPLGFMAALGVQVLFEDENHQPRLWWTEDVIPHAVTDGEFDVDRIVRRALEIFPVWLGSTALNPGTGSKADNDAKFKPDHQLREYLKINETGRAPDRLACCLVAEGSYDRKGNAKPSDLYLSAGRVAFLRDARKIISKVSQDDLIVALRGPWQYNSKLPSLRWNTVDDPNWALAPTKPGVNKRTCPGVEALALLGFSLFPVFGKLGRTLTQNCEGEWTRGGKFVWPLWRRPLSQRVARSLLAHVVSEAHPAFERRTAWFTAWSIDYIVESGIRRSKTASGLGNMGPSRIIYSTMNI